MNINWVKRGRIYNPAEEQGLIRSHAQIPTAFYIPEEKKIRIYIATRPVGNVSQTTFIDVRADDPSEILCLHDRPVIELGKEGTFDEHGIMPNVVLRHSNKVYLYYIGWSRRVSVPYSNWAGLALSDDNGVTFRKISAAPILDRTHDDIYSAATSSIIIENDTWHLWYVSGIDWVRINGKFEHTYSIKYASSKDGIVWTRDEAILIHQNHPMEAITRPTVLKIGVTYHMWFCYRGSRDFRNGADSYRIGYASSMDMKTWKREDEKSGISASATGWDSKMMAYPYVLKVGNNYLMFYNGNSFGQEGFGYAIAEFNK